MLIDENMCVLYEIYSAYPNGDGSWSAGSGAIYDLRSYDLRPDGWTSADAAGLAILTLINYVRIGIRHLGETANQAEKLASDEK